jgi:hypothetical protein
VLPDGTEKVLLNMPKYDFNWQREYIYKDLIELPAETKLVADYWYDNSDLNPANPDPNKEVVWGDQSFEEMLFTSVQFRWVDETAGKPRDDLQKILQERQMFTIVDDNLNSKIEEAELKGPMMEPLKAYFAQLDSDKDGGLTPVEFAAGMTVVEQARAKARAARGGVTG